jgi:hypothetical protein
MSEQDNKNQLLNSLNEVIENKWTDDKNDFEWYFEYTTPSEDRIVDVAREASISSKEALKQAKQALEDAKKAQDKAETLKWIIIALFAVLVFEMIWWVYSSIIYIGWLSSNYERLYSELESNIVKIQEQEKHLNEKIDDLDRVINDKVSNKVNEALLEIYKNQNKKTENGGK